MGRKRTRNNRVIGKTAKNGPILSQILLSIVDKNSLFGRQCLCVDSSQPAVTGPQVETFKEEGNFNYNVQLSDHQELLWSSRNLDQKVTPRHVEHSNSLCSRDRISRTQVHLCARLVLLERRKRKLSGNTKISEIRYQELRLSCARKLTDEIRLCWKFRNFPPNNAELAHRVFLTHNELICEPRCVGKRTCSDTTWNSRLVNIFPGLAGISIGKMPSDGPKTPRWPLFAGPYLSSPNSVSRESKTLRKRVAQDFQRYQERQKPTSGARSNMHANIDEKYGKRVENLMRFSSRTTAFARKFLSARCNLIHELRCVGKRETPAITCNSRFAGGFPRLAGIFTGKMRKNGSAYPTSRSHNFSFQTPICTNFIPLESRHLALSNNILHNPFWVPEDLQNCLQKSG